MIERARHLVARFAASLRPRPLSRDDLRLVQDTLTPAELGCWQRLGRADRAESVATARNALAELGPEPDRVWVAAAMLHDVGKAETGLGPFRRSAATVVAIVVGEHRVRRWSNPVGRYVDHDELGAQVLERAGARREAVEWAAIHHRPKRWVASGIPLGICQILAAADGEPRPR